MPEKPGQAPFAKGLLFCQRCHLSGKTSRLIYTEATNGKGGIYHYYLCRGRQEGYCDLPLLSVASVEASLERHVAELDLPADFVDTIRQYMHQATTDEAKLIRDTNQNLDAQLKKLGLEENRLLDLASDGSLNTAKLKERLRKLNLQRERITTERRQSVTHTANAIAALGGYLGLLASPHQ